MKASFFRGPLGLVTLGLVSVTICVLLLLPAVGHGYLEAPGGDNWITDDAGDGGGGAWRLLGNAGTTAANFLGTTDMAPLDIRTSGTGRIHVLAGGGVTVSMDPNGFLNDLTLAAPNSLFMPNGSWLGVAPFDLALAIGDMNLATGDVNVTAGDINMFNGSWLGSGTFDLTLNMGDVNVDTGDVNVMAGAINMPFAASWNAAGMGDMTVQGPAAAAGGNLFVSPPPAGFAGGNVVVGMAPAAAIGFTSTLLVTDGKVGVGRIDPTGILGSIGEPHARLHIEGAPAIPELLVRVEGIGNFNSAAGGGAVGHHIAYFNSRDNPANTTDSADGIAIELEVEAAVAAAEHNFITFFQTGVAGSLGAIEAGTAGGGLVTYSTAAGSDFAEGLPKLVPGENIEPGMIVGVYGGYITKDTVGADHIMVISTTPGFLGAKPPDDEQDDYGIVAFMGRVPVLVRAPVSSGDFIMASGMADGTAVAVNPADIALEDIGNVVGRAWADLEGGLLGYVTVVVGVNSAVSGAQALPAQIARINELQAELDRTQSQLAAMSRRMAQLEAAIAD